MLAIEQNPSQAVSRENSFLRCWSRWEPAAFMAFPPSLSAWALGAPSDGNVNPLVSAQGRKFKGRLTLAGAFRGQDCL